MSIINALVDLFNESNFLNLAWQNWVMILVLIGAAFSIGKMISKYLSLSNEEKVEVAKNMLQMSIDVDVIVKATGLSAEDVEALRNL